MNQVHIMTEADNPYIVGVDEAGRGPLAGPVVAAAVILDQDRPLKGLTDSKKIGPKKRTQLAQAIKSEALYYAIAVADVDEIDQLNILQASLLAMSRAVDMLKPDHPVKVLVDGNRLPDWSYESEAIVKGDMLVEAISAASILAKVYRDELMDQYAKAYPLYGFENHKGYPTKTHLQMLSKYGVLAIHRQSFKPVKALLMT